jgi:hypothetical protein
VSQLLAAVIFVRSSGIFFPSVGSFLSPAGERKEPTINEKYHATAGKHSF